MSEAKQPYTPPDNLFQWYVVRAKPRQELRALANLANQQITAFMPRLTVTKIRRGKRTQVIEPMFPGYIFVELDQYASMYHKVKHTFGVAKIITFGEQPAIVPQPLIDELQSITPETTEGVAESTPQIGATMEVIDGPFKGMLAKIIGLDGDSRCIVLLDWLHQQVQAGFDYQQLRQAD